MLLSNRFGGLHVHITEPPDDDDEEAAPAGPEGDPERVRWCGPAALPLPFASLAATGAYCAHCRLQTGRYGWNAPSSSSIAMGCSATVVTGVDSTPVNMLP